MTRPVASTMQDAPARADRLRRGLFTILCAVSVVLLVDVAAAIGQARHAGWIAGSVGLLLALLAAWRLRSVPASFLDPAAVPRAGAPVSPAVLLAAGVALFLLVLLPVLSTPLPPFDDYVNHLARIFIIGWDGHDPLLGRFYAIHWKVIPNLAMDLTVPLLAPIANVYVAGKVFLIACIALLLLGPFAIQQALYRQLSLGPLAATLFVHDYVEKMGVVNYQFGVGLALFAIAGWIALRPAGAVWRGLFSLGCVVVLFFCHLVALGLYGLAIGSYELWRLRAQAQARRHWLRDGAALVLPFAAAALLLLLGPVNDAPVIPSAWGGIHARLDGLRMLVQSYDAPADLIVLAGMIGGLLWAARRRAVALHPFGWMFLLVAGIAFLLVPNRAMGSWGGAARLPYGNAFVVCGVLRWDLPTMRAQRAFLLVLAALLLVRIAAVEAAFARYDRVRRDVVASLAFIVPGSRILLADDYAHADDRLRAIRELPTLAVIERSSLVATEYSHPMGQVLTVRPPYRAITGGYNDDPVALPDLLHPPPADVPPLTLPYDPSGRIYWAGWAHNYDYVYVFDRPDRTNPAPDVLAPLYAGRRVELFRVKHD